MTLFKRENYLSKMRAFYDDPEIIKVITGVRRCGKSSLMKTVSQELVSRGVKEENIIFLDLDSREYRIIKTGDMLDEALEMKATAKGLKYVFIDEIQNVSGFEEVINAYRGDGEFSIFITGSNSYLLSGELATKLTGRYIEFEMFPLSFEEYIEMKKFYNKPVNPNLMIELDSYLLEGGFPFAVKYDNLADKRIIENANCKDNFCDSETVLQITNLEKKYVSDSENLTVLHDLNLTVKKGSKLLAECYFKYGKRDISLLDVGCGIGFLGISISKIMNVHADMVDVNNRAIHLCKMNMKENDVDGRVWNSNVKQDG